MPIHSLYSNKQMQSIGRAGARTGSSAVRACLRRRNASSKGIPSGSRRLLVQGKCVFQTNFVIHTAVAAARGAPYCVRKRDPNIRSSYLHYVKAHCPHSPATQLFIETFSEGHTHEEFALDKTHLLWSSGEESNKKRNGVHVLIVPCRCE